LLNKRLNDTIFAVTDKDKLWRRIMSLWQEYARSVLLEKCQWI